MTCLILARSGCFQFHKYTIEVSYRSKATFHRYACNGHIGGVKQLAGVIYSQLAYVCGKVYVQIVGYQMRYMVTVYAERFTYGIKGNTVGKIIFIAVFEYSLNARHVQLASRNKLAR